MDPRVWGPSIWFFIHSTALAYPESNPSPSIQSNYKLFFQQLAKVLPCARCQKHFNQYVENTIDSALQTREALFRWTVDAHNAVNKVLGKTIVPYEKAKKLVSDRYVQKRNRLQTIIPCLILTFFIFVVLLLHFTDK